MLCTLNDKFTSKKESGLQIIWGSFFRSLKLVFTTWMETTPIQQLACSDAVASSILQQLHQHIQHQQQELQKLQQENCCNHQSQPLQDRHANAGTVSNENKYNIFCVSIPKGINRKILG